MAVPNIFKYASGTVLLEELDTNFATPVTIGTTPVALGATVGSFEGVTLVAPTLTTPALGTPASAVLTNCTDLPIATGVSGLAAGASTFLTTPSSANLSSLLSDETGTGSNVFATSPTLTTPTVTALNGGQLAGLRNRIINGSALIAQRGVITLGSTTVYATDRVLMSVLGGTGITATGSSSALAGGSSGLGHYLTGSFTTGQPIFAQRIESANCFDLNSKTITVSGRFFQNTGASQVIQVRVSKPTTTKDVFSATTVLQTSASITIPNGTTASTAFSATFTLGATDASLGLMVEVYIATIITQSVAANFAISDWQLEIGSVATPFEQRPYGMELALCQRYYETINTLVMHTPYTANSTSAEMQATWIFKVSKRATGASIQSATSIIPSSVGTDSLVIQLITNPAINITSAISATASSEL